jgi:hypothetical protein
VQVDAYPHKLTDKAEHNVFMGWSMAVRRISLELSQPTKPVRFE